MPAVRPGETDEPVAVLVADGSDIVASGVRVMLRSAGIASRVGVVGTAEDALVLLGDAPSRYQLLICDLKLRAMGGLPMLTEARRRLGDALPAVVVVSSLPVGDGLRRALGALGVRHALEKPVRRTELATTCREALRAARQRAARHDQASASLESNGTR